MAMSPKEVATRVLLKQMSEEAIEDIVISEEYFSGKNRQKHREQAREQMMKMTAPLRNRLTILVKKYGAKNNPDRFVDPTATDRAKKPVDNAGF